LRTRAEAEAQAVRAEAEAARVQADAELVEAVGMLQQAELDAASIREEAQRVLDQARATAQAIAPARGPVQLT